MKTNILTTLGFALLCSCTAVNDFDFQDGDGGTGDVGPSDTGPTPDGDSTPDAGPLPDAGPPPADAGPDAPLSLTVEIVADGMAVDTEYLPDTRTYEGEVGFLVRGVSVTLSTDEPGAVLTLDTATVLSGEQTPVDLGLSDNRLSITITQDTRVESYILALDREESLGVGSYIDSDTPAGGFSNSIAVTEEVLVVGAWNEDDGAGAAYIFERVDDAWVQTQRVVSADPEDNGNFGQSVATDGNFVAVGAYQESSGDGAVYVFQKRSGTWTAFPVIELVGDENRQFGSAVAVDGRRLVIGALGTSMASGAVYTYSLPGSAAWIAEQELLPPAGMTTGSQFGNAVAISGDTLVVAAYRERSDGPGGVNPVVAGTAATSGAVFVYTRDASAWTAPVYLKAFHPQESDRFGSAIAIDGDVIAVGAPGEDSQFGGLMTTDGDELGALDSGAVYTFRRDSDGEWHAEQYFKAETPEDSARYGDSVALWGNLLFVGAPEAPGDSRSGTVALYAYTDGWAYLFDMNATGIDPEMNDDFGASLSVGVHGLIVSAPSGDAGSGAVYSFDPVDDDD